MSFDDLKRQIESMKEDNKKTLDTQIKNIQDFSKSSGYGDFKLRMILDHISSDIYYLQKSNLDYAQYFILMAQKIVALEDRVNQNAQDIIEVSSHVKETELLQEQLNQQLRKWQKDSQDFKTIVDGMKEIVEARKRELEKQNKQNHNENKSEI